jgi:hypothetical protein
MNKNTTEVKVIKQWNGVKPKINPLLYHFHIWLAGRKLKEISKPSSSSSYNKRSNNITTTNTTKSSSITWIERLLQTPIEDYRKYVVSLILAPYLINIKSLSYQEAFSIIKEWLLNKCNSVRKLDCSSDFNYRIRYALDNAIKKGYKPISFEKLKELNIGLYDKLHRTK